MKVKPVGGPARRRAVRVLMAVLVAAGVVAVGCGSTPGSGAPPASGIEGTTVVDVGCPVVRGTSGCPLRPLRARIVVVRGYSDVVAQVDSGADGRFRIPLDPGAYVLRPDNLASAPVPSARPMEVTVRAGAFARVVVRFDSGVRGPAG